MPTIRAEELCISSEKSPLSSVQSRCVSVFSRASFIVLAIFSVAPYLDEYKITTPLSACSVSVTGTALLPFPVHIKSISSFAILSSAFDVKSGNRYSSPSLIKSHENSVLVLSSYVTILSGQFIFGVMRNLSDKPFPKSSMASSFATCSLKPRFSISFKLRSPATVAITSISGFFSSSGPTAPDLFCSVWLQIR